MLEDRPRVMIGLRHRINPRLLSVTISVSSFALIVLEILLLPWDEIRNDAPESALSLLSIICMLVSMIAIILSVATVIHSEKIIKKEKERLRAALSYMNLVNKASNNDEELELLLEELMRIEMITRKEYVNLRTFYQLTNGRRSITEGEDNIESVIDNAKDILIKLSDTVQKQADDLESKLNVV